MVYVKKYTLLSVFFFLFAHHIHATDKYFFDFNERCKQAYQDIQSLKFNSALILLNAEKSESPQNAIPYFLDNYIDFISIYIHEEEAEFDRLEKNKETRLTIFKSSDNSSPYFYYIQAEVLIQWAFARLKFEEYVTAFTEIKKAYALLEQNQKKFPDFIANKKSLGMLHCLMGAIPDQYKWGANALGLDGSIQQGLGELKSIIDYGQSNTFIFLQETYLYYAFLQLYLEKNDAGAWNIVKNLDTKNNLLNVFCVASVAMRTGKNDFAINTIQNKPTGSAYINYSYVDFMLGLAKMRRLDSDASSYFEKFIQNFKGKNYIAEAYQKLGWNALIQGNKTQYEMYMQKCLQYGDDIIDDDKQAMMEAKNGVAPNVLLLKSRLLFDGGYYKKAMQLLEGKSVEDFSTVKDKAEFTYRAARIYHASGDPEKAKGFYAATIKNGASLSYYFAASAALQLGFIYEKEKNLEKAKYYFHKCIDMDNTEYKTGLDSQAKAGLNRVGG